MKSNNKGFTLVELLAVIAILAILVIVAMPNVLGMFNQAKSSTFVTEVQEYLSAAYTKFMTEALKQGKIVYASMQNGKFAKPTYNHVIVWKNTPQSQHLIYHKNGDMEFYGDRT